MVVRIWWEEEGEDLEFERETREVRRGLYTSLDGREAGQLDESCLPN